MDPTDLETVSTLKKYIIERCHLNEECIDLISEDRQCKEMTPLQYAMMQKNREVFNYLLELGVENMVIEDLLKTNDREIVQQYCDFTSSTEVEKFEYLNYCIINDLDIIIASIPIISSHLLNQATYPPFLSACKFGNPNIINYLLDTYEVDVNVQNAYNNALGLLLHSRQKVGKHLEMLAMKILDRGANVQIEGLLNSVLITGNLNLIERVLQQGANPNLTSSNASLYWAYRPTSPPFFIASQLGTEMCDLLIKYGCIPTVVNQNDENVFHYLAQEHLDLTEEFVTKLINLGIDINHPNKIGNPPIFYANKKTVALFLRHGANCNMRNKKGLNFKQYLQQNNIHYYTQTKCEILELIEPYCTEKRVCITIDTNTTIDTETIHQLLIDNGIAVTSVTNA